MSNILSTIGLPEIIAWIIMVALNAYVLMGGADYGGGVWDLFASGPRAEAQRAVIADSIAPIWEANHVWLIVVVVMLFTAFPEVYATLAVVLHVPLVLLLIGIVLRGSSFVFRSYGKYSAAGRRRWGLIFAGASIVTPVLLGTTIGAIASGGVATAAGHVGGAPFADVFVFSWLAAFPIAVGFFALALFAFLAAVYLAYDAKDPELREDFRRRALVSAALVFVLAAVVLILAVSRAPRLARGMTTAPWAAVLHLCTAVAAITAIVALWRRRYHVARVAAGAQVTFILWGWVLAQYPLILPPTLSIRQAAAPTTTLRLLLIGVAIGAAVLIPSLKYLLGMVAAGRADAR